MENEENMRNTVKNAIEKCRQGDISNINSIIPQLTFMLQDALKEWISYGADANELLSIMKELLSTQENADWTGFADILEYKILPLLMDDEPAK